MSALLPHLPRALVGLLIAGALVFAWWAAHKTDIAGPYADVRKENR